MGGSRSLFAENFSANLSNIKEFLGGDGARAFQPLLDRLFDEVVPAICRFPGMGRSFLNRAIKSSRAAALAQELDDLLPKGHDLREVIADDYLILYVVGRAQITFLAIRHHRQLSFDLKHFWNNE